LCVIGDRLTGWRFRILQRLVLFGKPVPEFRVLQQLSENGQFTVDGFGGSSDEEVAGVAGDQVRRLFEPRQQSSAPARSR
jgi:hypothetical protein